MPKVLITALILGIFATYPLALIPPSLNVGFLFKFHIPFLFIVSLLSVWFLCVSSYRMPRWLWAVPVLYLPSIFIHAMRTDAIGWDRAMVAASVILIPAATCLASQALRLQIGSCAKVGFILYAMMTIYGFIDWSIGSEVVAATGNRNWTATLMLAAMPWAIYALSRGINVVLKNRMMSIALATAVAVPPGIFLVLNCRSRAAPLALAAYAAMLCFWLIRSRSRSAVSRSGPVYTENRSRTTLWRATFLIAVLAGGYGFAIISSQTLTTAIRRDVRLPLWHSTARIIQNYPLIGIGYGRLTETIPGYMTHSYHDRLVAAELTTHPHNELLMVGAELGLFAALGWLILFGAVLLRNPFTLPVIERFAHYTAFLIVVHGMLDKTMVQAPTDIIALACVGLCLRPYIKWNGPRNRAAAQPRGIWAFTAAGVFVLIFGLGPVAKETRRSWHMRRALQYTHFKQYDTALSYYQRAAEIDPNCIRAYYAAASISVQRLLDPERAQPFIEEAEKRMPDFAHLNRLLGQYHAMRGDERRALDYFKRDSELFPKNTRSQQDYFMCLVNVGKYQKAKLIAASLSYLYCRKNDIQFLEHPGQGEKFCVDWLIAVARERHGEARDAARGLLHTPIFHQFIDPMLYRLDVFEMMPATTIYGSHSQYDSELWRSVLHRRQTLLSIQAATKPDAVPTVRDVFESMQRSLTIDESIPGFTLPYRLTAGSSINSLSWYAGLMWLYRGCSYAPLLYLDAQGRPAAMFVIDGRHIYKITTSPVPTLSAALPLQNRDRGKSALIDLSRWIQPTWQGPKLFFLPQEFLLRNQMLGVLYRYHRRNPPFMPVDKIPFLTCLRVNELTGQQDAFAIEKLVWQEPIRLTLTANFPKAPPGASKP